MKKWARALFQPNLPLKKGEYVTASKEHIALSKKAAEEGMVLLKNDHQLLPLKKGSKVALFGKGSFDYVKGGGGSGDVTTPYVRNLYEGIQELGAFEVFEPLADFYRKDIGAQYANGAVPGMTVEPELSEEMAAQAGAFADTAIIIISRFSGEGWDRSSVEYSEEHDPWKGSVSMPQISAKIFPDGDFYLTAEEKAMIAKVKEHFKNIAVLLNIGGVIDLSMFKNDEQIRSLLWMGQGGMEGGLAAAEVLCGEVNPSGKLVDTYAAHLEDYPSTETFHESFDYVDYFDDIYVGYRYFETVPGAKENVCYPFGFGMSYTKFEIEVSEALEKEEHIEIQVQVKNIGDMAGKEVVQVYFGAPQGKLGKPAKALAAFEKTKELLPGESQTLLLKFKKEVMASYDDLGKVAKSAYVLEKGIYEFYVGTSVRDTEKLGFTLELKEDVVTQQLSEKIAPTSLSKRMLADGSYEELPIREPRRPNESVIEKMIPGTDEGIVPHTRGREQYLITKAFPEGAVLLQDVCDGKATLEEFMAQLSDRQLIELLGGQPNLGVANTFGFGNLPEYGVPNIMTADGPAGVRVNEETGVCTTAWPCATMLASTWNTKLAEEVGIAGGEELKENNLCVWLTPALNIHRNPLCGRNFEYYSEDPVIAGKMGAAVVRGIQSNHVAATPKHFAVNNKETNRKHSDSRLSERALREIYLKGFEIIVKEAQPWVIMSSYNIINGYRASECKELLTDILREEWGYQGVVTTDWWTRGEQYKEIKAGNDIKMACGYPDRVLAAMEKGAITREEIEICVKRVLELILKME